MNQYDHEITAKDVFIFKKKHFQMRQTRVGKQSHTNKQKPSVLSEAHVLVGIIH